MRNKTKEKKIEKSLLNWYKLLAGFNFLYEAASSAGNNTIQNHVEKVIDDLDNIVNHPKFQQKESKSKPVCIHLKPIIKERLDQEDNPLLEAIAHLNQNLTWEWGYETMPEHLKETYAYTEFIGPKGNFYSDHLVTGLVLLGPGCHYPSHRHPGIEESYIVLSGECNVNDCGVFKNDSLIYTPSGKPHELNTGLYKPCLLAFSWVAEPEILKNYSMHFE